MHQSVSPRSLIRSLTETHSLPAADSTRECGILLASDGPTRCSGHRNPCAVRRTDHAGEGVVGRSVRASQTGGQSRVSAGKRVAIIKLFSIYSDVREESGPHSRTPKGSRDSPRGAAYSAWQSRSRKDEGPRSIARKALFSFWTRSKDRGRRAASGFYAGPQGRVNEPKHLREIGGEPCSNA